MGTQVYKIDALIERLKQEKREIEEAGEEQPYVLIGDMRGDLSFEMDEGPLRIEPEALLYASDAVDTEKGLLDLEFNMDLTGLLLVGASSISEEAAAAAVTVEGVREAFQSDDNDGDADEQ